MVRAKPKLAQRIIKKRIREALLALRELGLPREQQNERLALVLLALLGLKPETPWERASSPALGITEMMDFFARSYQKRYAPNTRETVRRYSVHQFQQAGILVSNPDNPSRPTNSPRTVYQVVPQGLRLLRTFGSSAWVRSLKEHLETTARLTERYARERNMRLVPVRLASGRTIRLSPGGQNVLVKLIIDEFCARYTPGAITIYVGDTSKKWAYFDKKSLAQLGVEVEEHGKMPDVVVYHPEKEWLVLIEAVSSHGPVSPKRRVELEALFRDARASLVFVTTFPDQRTMARYLREIAWETEVWVASSPTHLIHFNGDRFLGPHEDRSKRAMT